MNNKHEKDLNNQGQLHSGLEYSEVNPSEFEREMTMVYLQLKGEFSPERVSGSTEKLAITQDLLMPSVMDIDKPVISEPHFIAVICKKAEVLEMDVSPAPIPNRTSLQPVRLPECNDVSKESIVPKVADCTTVVIPKTTVPSSFSAGVSMSATPVKNDGILIPNSPPEIKLNDVTTLFQLTSHHDLLTGVMGVVSSAVANAITCESASKSYDVEVPEVCIGSSIPRAKIVSISEYAVIKPNGADECVDEATTKGTTYTIVSVNISEGSDSLARSQNTAGILEGVRLFMPDCSSVQDTRIEASIDNFRTVVPTLNTTFQPCNSFCEFTKQQICISSPVHTELNVSSVLLAEITRQHKSAKIETPSFKPIVQNVLATIPTSRVRIDAPNIINCAHSAGDKPDIYVSDVEIYQSGYENVNTSLQHDVFSNKVIVPKRLRTSHSSPTYKVGERCTDVTVGQITRIHFKNNFNASLDHAFDFSDAAIQDAFDKVFPVKFNRYHTHADYRKAHTSVQNLILPECAPLFAPGKSAAPKISIPSIPTGMINKIDEKGLFETEHVHITLPESVPFEKPTENLSQGQSATVEWIPPLSIEHIRKEAEGIFEFFKQ